MPSIRSRLFLWLLHNRHLLQFKLKKETAPDWENNLEQVRAKAARSAKLMGRVPKGQSATPVQIGPMPGEWLAPEGEDEDKVILYFHGGGYVLGSIEAHRAIVGKFVKGTGLKALLFDYRLAPEHPHPAALEDALAAYDWMLEQGLAPQNIVFAGDSAGAGLALATLLALKDNDKPLPAAAAVLSPWTDVACTGESLETNSHLCLAPQDSWLACKKHYCAGADPKNPYISPLYGDLAGLPPLYITAGGHETLLSDSIRFAQKAKAAGVDVTLTVGEGMCHCYPACAPMFPEASRALANVCQFIKEELK